MVLPRKGFDRRTSALFTRQRPSAQDLVSSAAPRSRSLLKKRTPAFSKIVTISRNVRSLGTDCPVSMRFKVFFPIPIFPEASTTVQSKSALAARIWAGEMSGLGNGSSEFMPSFSGMSPPWQVLGPVLSARCALPR